MTAFLIHNMAPIMFAALVLFLLLGYPVAFSLAATGLFFALIGIELGFRNYRAIRSSTRPPLPKNSMKGPFQLTSCSSSSPAHR